MKTVSKRTEAKPAEDLTESLRHFDKDSSGFISSVELRHLFTTLGKKLSDDEMERLVIRHRHPLLAAASSPQSILNVTCDSSVMRIRLDNSTAHSPISPMLLNLHNSLAFLFRFTM